MKKLLLMTLLSILSLTICAKVVSSYKGEETRTIKAMSAKQVNGYLSGKGLGLAKAAELNHSQVQSTF